MPANGISDFMPPGAIPPRFHADLKKEAAKSEANRQAVLQFFDDVEKGSIPAVKVALGTIGRIEELRGLIALYRLTGGASTTLATRRRLMQALFMTRGRGAAKLLEELAAPASRLGKVFAKFAGKANGAALIVTAVEVSYHLSRGDIGPAFSELFKFAASKLWPWAAVIEAVQSLVDGICPDRQTADAFNGVIRMLDPVGVGSVGVDAVVTFAEAAFEASTGTGLGSDAIYLRLNRLTERMQGASTGWIAQKSYNMGRMTKAQWKQVAKQALSTPPGQRVPMGMMP